MPTRGAGMADLLPLPGALYSKTTVPKCVGTWKLV